MKHLNGNILAVVDVETTGILPRHHDIIEVCVLPLDHMLNPLKDRLCFNVDMRPKRPENVDLDALRLQPKRLDFYNDAVVRPDRICKATIQGIDADKAADMFLEWFEGFKLAPNKRIMPIAHNWVFDREFIIDWLGFKLFDYCFDPRYRDTQAMSLYENDRADWRGNEHPFPKNNLAYLCRELRVERDRAHTALDDCLATAEVFKRLIKGGV